MGLLNINLATDTRIIKGKTYYIFPVGGPKRNQKHRPQFITNETSPDLVTFPQREKINHPKVHILIVSELNQLLDAMKQEGKEIDDASLKSVHLGSGYRPPGTEERLKYLNSMKQRYAEKKAAWGNIEFTQAMERAALGDMASQQGEEHFIEETIKQSGWNRKKAKELLDLTRAGKAPSGKSTHHSGFTADINFEFANSKTSELTLNQTKSLNKIALTSAAGRWLYEFAAKYGFLQYNTHEEVFHIEYIKWEGKIKPAQPSTENVGTDFESTIK